MDAPFSIHGVLYDEREGMFLRLPTDVSLKVSEEVCILSRMTSGGRVRFRTNSSYIAIFCRAPAFSAMPHMPITGSHGFSVYCNGKYMGKVVPSVKEVTSPHQEGILFGGVVKVHSDAISDIEVYMPLYGGVCELQIGIGQEAVIEGAREYTHKAPIVIYGSSVAQGACASRPGNDFAMRLSRLLDADVLNLGFSGNGNAEPAMLEYLASLDASVFVFDYNYYSYHPDRILPPHFEIYKTLREAQPSTPILMIDKPAYMFAREDYQTRSEIIRATYERARALGDMLVDRMDAKELFGEEEADACLVDNNHPNDLGFYRMADALCRKLRVLLEKGKRCES